MPGGEWLTGCDAGPADAPTGSCVSLNGAVGESVAASRTAFARPEMREALAKYPESVVASPHLLREVDVPGVCTG